MRSKDDPKNPVEEARWQENVLQVLSMIEGQLKTLRRELNPAMFFSAADKQEGYREEAVAVWQRGAATITTAEATLSELRRILRTEPGQDIRSWARDVVRNLDHYRDEYYRKPPTQKDLTEMDRNDMVGAIAQHGRAKFDEGVEYGKMMGRMQARNEVRELRQADFDRGIALGKKQAFDDGYRLGKSMAESRFEADMGQYKGTVRAGYEKQLQALVEMLRKASSDDWPVTRPELRRIFERCGLNWAGL